MSRRRGQRHKEQTEPGMKAAPVEARGNAPTRSTAAAGTHPEMEAGHRCSRDPSTPERQWRRKAHRRACGGRPRAARGALVWGTPRPRGEARQTRHDASTAAATHAGGRPSRRPSSPTRRRDGACATPTARPVATPTAHAHALTRGGRWPERHAGGAANESAASGGAGERPVRDAKKTRALPRAAGPRKADWAGPLAVNAPQNLPLSSVTLRPGRPVRAGIATLLSAAAIPQE